LIGKDLVKSIWTILLACGVFTAPVSAKHKAAKKPGRAVVASYYDAPQRSSFASRHKEWRGKTFAITYQGKTVHAVCRDSGPYVRGRQIDVGRDVARRLGFIKKGVATVHIRPVK
jgi:hypothetical protein